MNQRQGICIFVAAFSVIWITAAVCIWILSRDVKNDNEEQSSQPMEETMSEELLVAEQSMRVLDSYAFMAVLEKGEINVYSLSPKEFLFSINATGVDCTYEQWHELEKGMYFTDEEELLDYIESVTS